MEEPLSAARRRSRRAHRRHPARAAAAPLRAGLRAPALRGRLALALLALAGCAPRTARPPTPEDTPPPAPALAGMTVMLVPAQTDAAPAARRVAADFDAEAADWLVDAAPAVTWIAARKVEAALARNPALAIDPHALAVGDFARMRVETVGEPLAGDLRRMGALMDARLALVPVRVRFIPVDSARGRVEAAAALIDTWGGNVLWYAVVAGQPRARADEPAVATAARALARALLPDSTRH